MGVAEMSYIMVVTFTLVLLSSTLLGSASGASSPDCCRFKEVGGVKYSLAGIQDTSAYNCLSPCVYMLADDINRSEKFCFAAGDLEVVCGEMANNTDDSGLGGENDLSRSCPVSEPSINSECSVTPFIRCRYGVECCCGRCYHSMEFSCSDGSWTAFATDFCEIDSCEEVFKPSDDCACLAVWNPVCGVDGQTHSNFGCANCRGVKVECIGECPCKKLSNETVAVPETDQIV